MVTANYFNKFNLNKSLYLILTVMLVIIFVLQIVNSQRSGQILLPIKEGTASSNPFPSAQYNNSPIGFELYDAALNTTTNTTTYVSRGNNYALFLTPSEAVVTLNNSNSTDSTSVLHMQYVGANKSTKLTALDDNVNSKSHYFMGNDPAKWKTNVNNYKKVQYKDLYPGIDLLFYGNQRQLEYDFIVAPNVDPNIIRLNFTGSNKLSNILKINDQGDLLIQTRAGHVLQKKPVIYQLSQNPNLNNNHKQIIEGSYVLLDNNLVGFTIGDYDHSQPLIIDPVLDYAIYIGGSDQDNGTRIAVDASGYIYITGYTFSTDFPGGSLLGSNVSSFITKLSPGGSQIIFSVYLGGSGIDRGRDIAISDDGDIFVVGETTSVDFPILDGLPFLPQNNQSQNSGSQNNGDADAFLAMISSDGTHIHYSTYLGGSGYDSAKGVAIGNNELLYIAGETWSNDFPVTDNALDNKNGSANTCNAITCPINKNYDAFFTVIDLLTNEFTYSTYLGGEGNDKAHAVAVDLTTGYGYIAGESTSTDFPAKKSIPSIGAYIGDHLQGFITVIDPTLATGVSKLDSVIFSSLLGGKKEDVVDSISVDTAGNVYLFGYTNSIDFPVRNAFQGFLRGDTDSFIAKLNPNAVTGLDALVYATYLGGSGAELSYGIAVDKQNRTYIVGTTSSLDFPTVAAFQNNNAGGVDAYVATLNADGTALQYASYLGGSGDETGSGIAVSADGTAYIVGDSVSTNLPATTSTSSFVQSTATDVSKSNNINAFIAKITPPPVDEPPAQTNNNSTTPPAKSSGGGANSPAFMVMLMLMLFIQLIRRP